MRFSRVASTVAASLGLVACGIAGTVAWQAGLWGSLTGAVLVAIWLSALTGWAAARPGPTATPSAVEADDDDLDTDTMIVRVLLDAAPTPLLRMEAGAARALNRAARRLFLTDDRILPPPAALHDPAATHLRHEGRNWRLDRVALPADRSVVALIDIEREERTAEARATAELIEVLGHELLNGLAPIVSLAESAATAVARPNPDVPLLREILGTLARRADGLQRFTEAYRALARLPEPTVRPVNLRDFTEDLARLFASRWPDIALSVDVADTAIWPLDRDLMHQALWAVLQNAAEAAADRPDGAVTLRLQENPNSLVIDVTDNGAPIPPDAVTRIFRPFHTTKPKGTGIGLSLARQVALAHGGVLALAPTPEKTLRFTLPAES